MDSTKLDRKIRLERYTSTKDPASGEPVTVWGELATVWASKRDVSDGERVAAAEVQSSITTRFQIRWSSEVADLNPRDRVVYDGKTYGIEAVKELGRRDGLEISATARNDEDD